MMKKPLHHNLKIWALGAGMLALLSSAPSLAQTALVDQALSFGRFVIVDFGDPIEIVIESDGSYTTNSNVYMIDEPTLGEYTLIDAPESSSYTITVPPSVMIGGGPGGNFIMDEITVTPTVLTTDLDGEDEFFIGARLRSAGGGSVYGDGVYSNTFTLIFNF